MHVDDVASAIASALMRPSTGGHAYDVAGPEPLTFRQLVREGAAAVGRRPLLFPIPLRPAVAAIGVYERVSSNPRLWAEQLERLGEDKAFDITPAQDELGFNPRSFTEGVQAQAKGGAP